MTEKWVEESIRECKGWREKHMDKVHGKIDETLEEIRSGIQKIGFTVLAIQAVVGTLAGLALFAQKMGWF